MSVSKRLLDEAKADVPARSITAPLPAGFAAHQQVKGMSRVLVDVVAERHRQDAKWGEQNHVDGTGPDVIWVPDGVILDALEMAVWARERCQENGPGQDTWLAIALEELAEAFAEDDPVKLRAELIQSAAVLVNWVQAIDRRSDGTTAVPADGGSDVLLAGAGGPSGPAADRQVCAACGGICDWVDDAWVCSKCGAEWYPEEQLTDGRPGEVRGGRPDDELAADPGGVADPVLDLPRWLR